MRTDDRKARARPGHGLLRTGQRHLRRHEDGRYSGKDRAIKSAAGDAWFAQQHARQRGNRIHNGDDDGEAPGTSRRRQARLSSVATSGRYSRPTQPE